MKDAIAGRAILCCGAKAEAPFKVAKAKVE